MQVGPSAVVMPGVSARRVRLTSLGMTPGYRYGSFEPSGLRTCHPLLADQVDRWRGPGRRPESFVGSLLSGRLQLKASTAAHVDKLHINVRPGDERCLVARGRLVLHRLRVVLNQAVMPYLVGFRVTGGGRVRIDCVRRPVRDEDAATIGLPTWNRLLKVPVRVGNAAVIFGAEAVSSATMRLRVATLPELLDELVAFIIAGELHKLQVLFGSNNPAHILVDPPLIHRGQRL